MHQRVPVPMAKVALYTATGTSWSKSGVIKALLNAFFRKLLKGQCYCPRKMVTDKLGSYGAARREFIPGVEHVQGKRENNRAEVSHQPTRQRERQMRHFKSRRLAQRFLSAHGPIKNLLRIGRHLIRAINYRELHDRSFTMWNEVSYVQKAGWAYC